MLIAGGIVMLIVGIVLTINISATMPAGQVGMTEEETLDSDDSTTRNMKITTHYLEF